jgi:hypothetical protein
MLFRWISKLSWLGFKPRGMVTQEDVVWCFANIVGRHPTSASEIDHYQKISTCFRDLVVRVSLLPECATRRTTSNAEFVYVDSVDVQKAVRAILKMLQPAQSVDYKKVRVGKQFDGGYVMLDDFDGIAAAYSIGISDEVSWDLGIAERGIEVFQYDHTIEEVPVQHYRFHWMKKGLGARATHELETLPRILEMNGHNGRRDLLLKCDIEGSELDVLSSLPADYLIAFKQIVLEVHFLERLVEPDFAALVEKALSVLTAHHRVVHVHANNHRPYCIIGGVPLPSVLELTLARYEDVRLVESQEIFPTPLDAPCYRDRADFCLGTFRF